MFALPLVVLAGLLWLEWRRTSDRVRHPRCTPALVMASGSAGAGGVHAVVAGPHADHGWLLGVFFLSLAVTQLAIAVALLGPVRPRVVLGGVGLNAGVVTLWVWTRVVGVPWGVGGDHRETVGALDLVATALEAGCVVAGLLLLYRATGGSPSPEDVPASRWEPSTVRNSPPPRKVSSPPGPRPSQETNSVRPSKSSTFATRS
jgi:hypothetical protein